MYTVDGLAPEGDGWLLFLTGSGIRGVSGRLNGMLELPGMDGAVPQFGTPFMPGSIPLRYRIWVETHAEFMAIIEMFNGVFGQRRKLLTVTHEYGSAVSGRENYATVTEQIAPEPVTKEFAYYQVTLSFPTPFWRSTNIFRVETGVITSTLSTYVLTDLDGTGPISDAQIRVSGGFSTATVEDYVTGEQITINTPVAVGEYALVNCADWTASIVTSDVWSGGTDISAQVSSNRGRGSMLTLEPDNVALGGRYRVRARATNPVGSPIVEVRARKSYH